VPSALQSRDCKQEYIRDASGVRREPRRRSVCRLIVASAEYVEQYCWRHACAQTPFQFQWLQALCTCMQTVEDDVGVPVFEGDERGLDSVNNWRYGALELLGAGAFGEVRPRCALHS
jgi:hypothetical protein